MMRGSKAIGVGIVGIATLGSAGACRTVAQPGPSSPPVSDTLGGGGRASGDGRIDLGGATRVVGASSTSPSASTTPPPARGPRWGRAPEDERSTGNAGLYTVLDGSCGRIGISVLQNEAVVTFGAAIARATDDGLVVDPAMNRGFPEGVYEVLGRWPDAAYALYDNGTRCTSSVRARHFQNGRWEEAFALPEDHSVRNVALLGNGAVGLRDCNWDCGSRTTGCGEGMYIGDNAKAPPIAGDGFRTASFSILPSGEVFAVGVVCPKEGGDAKCTGQLRWWSPGSKVGYVPLGGGLDAPGPAQDPQGWLVARSKTEVYVSQGDVFASFDGAKLTKLPAPNKGRTFRLFDAKSRGLWLEAGGQLFERRPDGTFADVTPPSFATLGHLTGIAEGAPWYMTGDRYGSWTQPRDLYRRVGESWQKVELPRPARASSARSYLTPEKVVVRAPDDVFVVASYHEMPSGWIEAERRRVLLRTKRPKETMRCGGPTSIEGWPPPALDTCTTPFVVFAEVSAASPKDYDYPKTRAVLQPRAELVVGGSLAEIRENGKVWIGVTPKSLEAGRKLVELYAQNWQSTHPEMVCATPNVTRTIPIVK
ncbi:MAG: hypothetical protein JST00_21160 [Deltaproteobacteria bacterium]|nr:hypothetical protein [Deltaproteobacteria bacterium]